MESDWYREFYKCRVCEFTSHSMPEIRGHVALEHDKLLSKDTPPVDKQETNSDEVESVGEEWDDESDDEEMEREEEGEAQQGWSFLPCNLQATMEGRIIFSWK